MKNSKFQSIGLNASILTREQMKNVTGGNGIPIVIKFCFKCCPDDPCSPVRHYCSDKICPGSF